MVRDTQLESELQSFGEWLKNKKEKSDKTVKDHQRVIRQYIDYHDQLPPRPSTDCAYDYKNHLRSRIDKDEVEAKHCNNHLVSIEYYYRWLREEAGEDLEEVELTRFKEKERSIKCMKEDEYDQILRRGIDNYRDEAIFLFMTSSGIRVTEMCGLDVGDILWEQNKTDEIRIKSNSDEIRYDNYRFSDRAKESLRKYLNTRSNTGEKDPLFTSLKDPSQRLGRSGVGQMLERVSKRAGLSRKITPHMCRAYFITELTRRDINLEQIRKLVNHKTIEQTAEYVDLRDDDLDDTYSSVFN